jgi:outer membrane protein
MFRLKLSLKTILITAIGLILILLMTYHLFIRPPVRIAYVRSIEVYNEFILKKELEKELERTIKLRSNSLDSMSNNYQQLLQELDNSKLKKNRKDSILYFESQRLKQKKEELEQANYNLAQELDQKIWKQLNQYIQDYADEYHYDFILGAKGDASLMAANKKYEITDKLIEYVNEKYNGK